MSKEREIDVFSNDTSVSLKDDVVTVKFDVKSLITSIFSQLEVNHSNFRYRDINVLPKMSYSWKGRHILYLMTLKHSAIVKVLTPQEKT